MNDGCELWRRRMLGAIGGGGACRSRVQGVPAGPGWARLRGGLRTDRVLLTEWREVPCPRLGRDVLARIEIDGALGHGLAVRACMALPDPSDVTCSQACLAPT